MAGTFLMIVNSALIAWMPSFERGAGVKDLPRSGDAVVLGVPGMDPGLEVQVLCGASWKQPQAEGNCTQDGASRDNPAWRREAVWGRSRRRAAAPNVSEALCRPGRSGERAKERDAQNPTEIGAVLGPGAAVHPVSLPWEVCMGPKGTPSRVSDGVRAVGRKEATTTGRRPCRSRISS